MKKIQGYEKKLSPKDLLNSNKVLNNIDKIIDKQPGLTIKQRSEIKDLYREIEKVNDLKSENLDEIKIEQIARETNKTVEQVTIEIQNEAVEKKGK